jgi:hypothetical protein
MVVVGAVFAFFGARAEAMPVSSAPREIEAAIRATCGAGDTNVAGPWSSDGDAFWAGVVWTQPSPHACLVLLRASHASVRVEAHGQIPAGYSSRYDEFFAPQLRAEPVRLAGFAPAPVTDATAMGAGGGGGDRTMVWLARAGAWSPAYDAVLNAASDINSEVTSPCPNAPPLTVQATRGGHAELRTRACFDGRSFTIRAHFDGTHFVP